MATEHYFAVGTTLAGMVNVETLISTPPTVLPDYGGAPMPLLGGAARRTVGGKLRRSGNAVGAWGFPTLDDDFTDLNALLVALYGGYTTASKELYVSTVDTTGHYSPFRCYVDAPYSGDTLDFGINDHPRAARLLLVGGVLQSATKTTGYTVTTSDHLLYANTASGSITFDLPALSGINQGVVYSFIKTSASNNMVLDPNSSEQIDGASTKTVTALNARVDIVSNGTQWVSI